MSYSLAYSRSEQSWQVKDFQTGNVVAQYRTRGGALAEVQQRNGQLYDALEGLAESALIPEITEEVIDTIEPFIREIAREGMETAEDLVSSMQKRKALGASELNRLVDNFIRDYRTQWSRNISDSTRGAIRETLLRGRRNGWAVEDVISTVRNQGFSPSRAQTIAVTETTEIYGQAAVSHYGGMGLQQWRWHTVADFAVDPICAQRHGQKFAVSEPFQPAHPNCRCFASPVPLPDGAQPPEHYDDAFDPTLMADQDNRRRLSMTDEYSGLVDGIEDLTEEARSALRKYKGSFYRAINPVLRGEDAPFDEVTTAIRGMDQAVDAQRLSRNTNLYRAPGKDFWEQSMGGGPLDESVIGAELLDDGFLSTSLSDDFAKSWNLRSGGKAPRMQIRAPQGQRASLMNRAPDNTVLDDGEMEVLLPRGTKLRVADIDKENNTMIMDIVPEGG